jgi:hypothetical protein
MIVDILIGSSYCKKLAENWEKIKVLVTIYIIISYTFMVSAPQKVPPHALFIIIL